MKINVNRKILSLAVLAVPVFLILTVIFMYFSSIPQDAIFSNITDRAVTVSWVTTVKSPGMAIIATDSESKFRILKGDSVYGYDDRDIVVAEEKLAEANRERVTKDGTTVRFEDLKIEAESVRKGWYYTHHVTITGLEPGSNYSVMVGNGLFFRQVGDSIRGNETVQTHALLDSLETPDPVYGKVGTWKGELADDGVVYMKMLYEGGIGSGILSSPIKADNGTFYLDLSNLHTPTGEKIDSSALIKSEIVWVEGGPNGRIGEFVVPTDKDAPMDSIILQDPDLVQFPYEESADLSRVFFPEIIYSIIDPDPLELSSVVNADGVGLFGDGFFVICAGECNNYCRRPPCPVGTEGGCNDGSSCNTEQEPPGGIPPGGSKPACVSPKQCIPSIYCSNGVAVNCQTGTACEARTDGMSACGQIASQGGTGGGNTGGGGTGSGGGTNNGGGTPEVPAFPNGEYHAPDPSNQPYSVRPFSIYAQVPEDPDRVLFDPVAQNYYFISEGEYRFTYEGVEYTVVLPEGQSYYTIFIDANGNGIRDEGETILTEDIDLLMLERVADVMSYEIKAGLNFISIPVVLDTANTASALLDDLNQRYGGVFYSIAKYDTTWKVVGDNLSVFNVNDFQIVPGSGYVLKSKADLQIELTGKQVIFESEGDVAPIYLTPGWNLVGLYGTKTVDYTAESLIDSVNGYQDVDFLMDNVSSWSVNRGMYQGVQNSEGVIYGTDFPLTQQVGFFMRVLQGEGSWQPEHE